MSEKLGRRPTDPDYGLGEHAIDCDRLGLIDEKELTERLIATFESPTYQPPRLPAVAMELLALSKRPDVEFRDLEAVLEQDAVLAGEVLSISRSAFYTRAQEAGSLRSALVRVGLKKLRGIVLEAAMNMRVFRSKSYRGCMDRLRLHCRFAAHLCRIVCRYTPIAEEQAFLCGLLHDVGIAGILLVLGDAKRGQEPPDLSTLWPAIHEAHAKAGSRMVTLWGLPPEISMTIGAHHEVSIQGYDHPLSATVCLAEAVAVDLGLAFVPAEHETEAVAELEGCGLTTHGRVDRSDDSVIQRAKEALRLDETTVELIREDGRAWAKSEGIPTLTEECGIAPM